MREPAKRDNTARCRLRHERNWLHCFLPPTFAKMYLMCCVISALLFFVFLTVIMVLSWLRRIYLSLGHRLSFLSALRTGTVLILIIILVIKRIILQSPIGWHWPCWHESAYINIISWPYLPIFCIIKHVFFTEIKILYMDIYLVLGFGMSRIDRD